MVISGAATRGGKEVELEVVFSELEEKFVVLDVDTGNEEVEGLAVVDNVVC